MQMSLTLSVCLCKTFFYIGAIEAFECFKIVMIVFEVFSECLKGVRCFNSGLSVFEGCFRSVSRVFQGYFKNALRVFYECFESASSMFQIFLIIPKT